MTRRLMAVAILIAAVLAAAVLYVLSEPRPVAASAVPQRQPDLANGKVMYDAGGCISCHKPAGKNAQEGDLLPSGGAPFKTPVGIFYPPNITPDRETGIGQWSDIDFVNAVQHGLSPSGTHYIPAFPYRSYAKMRVEDVLDLKAYLFSLPPVRSVNRPADVPLGEIGRYFGGRLSGLWKLAALDGEPAAAYGGKSAEWNRGAYLVSGAGHCSECHTPRTLLMIPDTDRAFQGGPHPEGSGKVPSLVNLIGRKRYKDADDLASALQFGETFGYDKLSSGGMGDVQTNLSKLPPADIKAIATYLASLK